MMPRVRRRLLVAAALLLAGVAGLWALLHALLPSDAQLAAQLGTRFEQSFGIGLRVGAAHWSLRPVPVVVLTDLATDQARPITVRRIVLHPQLAALWRRRELAFERIEVEGAVLPRASVRAFRGRAEPEALHRAGADLGWRLAERPLANLRLRDIVWIDRREIALAYDGDVEFDDGWRPRHAEFRRPGVTPVARLRLEREGDAQRWRTLIDVGGGTWNGAITLQAPGEGGTLRLAGQLEARDIDVEALMHSFGRSTPVAGKLAGHTELRAEGPHPAQLARSLHSRTRFTLHPAMLKHFDLAALVKSGGRNSAGRTVLDEFSGTVETQLTDAGPVLQYTELKARSGLLTATGQLRLADRKMQGEAAIDLVDGVVGVPLRIGGTLDAPQVSLTGGALAGAAVGSVLLPGVGTAIGARLGHGIERLLEGKPTPQRAPRASAAR